MKPVVGVGEIVYMKIRHISQRRNLKATSVPELRETVKQNNEAAA